MKNSNKHSAICRSLLCAASVLSVSACLPDGNGVHEKSKQELLSQQAGGFAAMLSSAASSREASLLISSSWLDGSISPGILGTTQDGNVAHAYCHDTSGSNDNHMIISWLTAEDDSGRFVASGIGTEGGTAIVQEMAKGNSAHTIGLYKQGAVHLRGPRVNGDTELTIASGCNLDIPEGAPIFVAENLHRVDSSTLDTATYEYKTSACPGDNVGMITMRRKVTTGINGNSSATNWQNYDSTCGGMESAHEVTINTTQGTIAGAVEIIGGGASAIKSELNKLSGNNGDVLTCSQVKTDEDILDENGKVIHAKGTIIAENCESADDVVTKKVEELGEAIIDKNKVLDYKTEIRECAAGNTGKTNQTGSIKGYKGKINILSGWDGNISYRQNLYEAKVDDTGDSDNDYKKTAQWGDWQGDDINCQRAENMTLTCGTVFTNLSNANVYRPIKDDGITFTRTNVIDGFADKVKMEPKDGLAGDKNWKLATPSCEWEENRHFACPTNLTEKRKGDYKRPVYMLAAVNANALKQSDFESIHQGNWTTTKTALCQGAERKAKLAVDPTLSRESFGTFGNGMWDIGGFSTKNNRYSGSWMAYSEDTGAIDYGHTAAQGNISQGSICGASWGADFIAIDTTIDIYEEMYEFDHNYKIISANYGNTPVESIKVKKQVGFGGEMRSKHFIDECIKMVTNAAKDHGLNVGYKKTAAVDWYMEGLDFNWTSTITFTGDMEGTLVAMKYSCLAGDTMVTMADGTLKAISQIKEGDVTATGLVRKTYARAFDPAAQHTTVAQITYRGGLYNYQGIKVTGNHVIEENGRWLEIADSAHAQLIHDDSVRMVYNLDIDSGIIPVHSQAGKLYFADNMNNLGGKAQTGLESLVTAKAA